MHLGSGEHCGVGDDDTGGNLTGAGSIEIELRDRSTDIISATRFLPAGFTVGAVVTDDGVLQVICTRDDAKAVVMRECSDWTAYTVRRAHHEGE